MEFVETFDELKIEYLLSLTLEDYNKIIDSDKGKDYCKSERKEWFDSFRDFLMTTKKTRFSTKRFYNYSKESEKYNLKQGRLYSNGIQVVPRSIRNFLCSDHTDIDMKNCAPTILKYICDEHNIPCANLEKYIKNRDSFISIETPKTLFIASMFSKNKIKNEDVFFTSFDDEMKKIQKQLVKLYSKDKYPYYHTNTKNINGSLLFKLCSKIENEVLQLVISYLQQQVLTIFCPIFDGVIVEGKHYDNTQLLTDIENLVESKYNGLNMMFAFKAIETDITIPEDFEVRVINPYGLVKSKFEETHFKLMHPITFVQNTNDLSDDLIIRNRKGLFEAYENIYFETINEENVIKREEFIKHWLKDTTIRTFDKLDFLPHHPEKPFENTKIYNLFDGFKVKKTEQEGDLANILQHIKNIVGTDKQDECYDYILNWLACCIQNPAKLLTALVFVSVEGTGKSLFFKWFGEEILGAKYFKQTSDSNCFFERFANGLKNKILVNWEEAEGKVGFGNSEKLKDLITNNTFSYEQKGKDTIDISNSAKWIINSNNDVPIKVGLTDRRFVLFRCDDKQKGNQKYFDKLMEDMKNPNICSSFYKLLLNRDISKWNHEQDRPITDVYKETQSYNISSFDEWMQYFVGNMIKQEDFMSSTELFQYYTKYCDITKRTPVSHTKFGINCKKLMEQKKTKNCNVFIVNQPALRVKLGLPSNDDNDNESISETE
jgi:hypothetical protein